MSKKHFVALAAALKEMKPVIAQSVVEREYLIAEAAERQWKRDVEAVADVCSRMNEQFNYHTFRDAAGIKSNP